MAKIGRNNPCHCGSLKKYKKCCGAISPRPHMKPDAVAISAMADAMRAQELLRQRAEGHGKPIISVEMGEYRVVGVGNRIIWGKGWRFFTDFLIRFMMDTLGPRWASENAKAGREHPVLTWFRLMREHQIQNPKDHNGVVVASDQAFAMATFRFAYALYLIAHHDALPKTLLRRLRDTSTFRPAALETLVFAAFALAGFTIKMGETRRQSAPEGEFTATSATTGKTYHIEAKRKAGWTAPTDVDDPRFQAELAQWIRQKLYAAAKKQLPNPIYWFELSIPNLDGRARVERVQQLIRGTLEILERELRVGGKIPSSAYVFVSNHAYLANDHATGQHSAMLDGFHLPMHRKGDRVDVEDALEQHDRDRDALWILDCLSRVQEVPHSFDGTPDELFDQATKKTIDRMRVGEQASFAMPDGSEIVGMITNIVSTKETGTAVVLDEATGTQKLVQFELTEEERRAAAALGDVVFGNPNGTTKIPDGDVGSLYDFFLKSHATTPRERLLTILENHISFEEFKALDTEGLRRRICREWTKAAVAHSTRQKSGSEDTPLPKDGLQTSAATS